MYLWEFGLSKQWFGKLYRGRFEQCIVKPVGPRMTALKLQDLYSAFIILAFGTAVSLLVLVFERIFFKSQKPDVNFDVDQSMIGFKSSFQSN
jgi:hypothetical protein